MREPKCPEPGCGVSVMRPRCLLELPPNECPRHALAEQYRGGLMTTIKLKRRKWVVGREYTSNDQSEGYPVLVDIKTDNGYTIAKNVHPHDAEEIVNLHNEHIVKD